MGYNNTYRTVEKGSTMGIRDYTKSTKVQGYYATINVNWEIMALLGDGCGRIYTDTTIVTNK